MLYIFLASGNIQTRIYFKLLLSYILTYWLTSWLYGRLRALAPLITEEHSSVSTVFCRHLLNFISRKFFSVSSLLVYIYVEVISNCFGWYTLKEWSLLEFPDDGYVCQPKRFEITLMKIHTIAVSCNKFLFLQTHIACKVTWLTQDKKLHCRALTGVCFTSPWY